MEKIILYIIINIQKKRESYNDYPQTAITQIR